MGLSACPGCGVVIEHGEDAVEFYSHMGFCAATICPDVNDPKLRQAAAVAPGLDSLFKELQESQTLTGAPEGAKFLLRGIHGEALTVADFAGAVVDEFFRLEEDTSMNKLLRILAMIPSIIGTVQQAEQTIVGQGKGPDKLNLVLSTVNAALSAVPEVEQSFVGHDLNGTVTAIVNSAVSAINAASQKP
jgi:hypothetical protein